MQTSLSPGCLYTEFLRVSATTSGGRPPDGQDTNSGARGRAELLRLGCVGAAGLPPAEAQSLADTQQPQVAAACAAGCVVAAHGTALSRTPRCRLPACLTAKVPAASRTRCRRHEQQPMSTLRRRAHCRPRRSRCWLQRRCCEACKTRIGALNKARPGRCDLRKRGSTQVWRQVLSKYCIPCIEQLRGRCHSTSLC